MYYLLSIYFSNKPLHVSSRLTAHHQEVLLCIYSNWYMSCAYVDDRYIVRCYLFVSARFVIPNCCTGRIQFVFDVLISVQLLCLLGIDKFNVLLTVRCDISVQ
jgi:hypothetical protein